MMNGIDIEQVKQYNRALKECKDKAAKIEAGIEINEAELNRLCKELSAELNMEVTPENVESIRDEYIKKINNTLQVGMELLNRIKMQEQQTDRINSASASAPAPVAVGVPVGAVNQQVIGMSQQIGNGININEIPSMFAL